MNVIEFIENVYECHLSNYQKDYIRKIYDSIKKNNRIFIYRPSRGCTKVAIRDYFLYRLGEEGLFRRNGGDKRKL